MSAVDVAEELTRMPAQPFAATLILRLVDDPDASAAQLARLVEMDPALSARVMRLANSPHYGLRAGVGSAARAVVFLGFSAVRGIAAASASCLLADDVNLGPEDHWAHSVSVAAAAGVAAEVFGVTENEAFSAGLLHDVGSALLHSAHTKRYEEIMATCGSGGLLEAEQQAFGCTHSELGAEALLHWNFPKPFVQAVANHHEPVAKANPLGQAVILGEALAERLDPLRPIEGNPTLRQVATELSLSSGLQRRLLESTERGIAEIRSFIGGIK